VSAADTPVTGPMQRGAWMRHGTQRTAKPAAQPAQGRNNALAQIHIAKAQLGMDDDTYRDMLWAVARVKSAKDLDHAGRAKVMEHLKRSGFKSAPPRLPHPGRPHNIDSEARGPQIKKVQALLADAGRPWAYADGIAHKMFGIAKVALCNEEHLQKLIAALVYDQKRRAQKGGAQ
jgi:phage gp16-like protein